MRYACAAFYSHPWAWNEIGFGGPAYPRGYANLGLDRREHWERPEHHAADPIPWVDRAEAATQGARRAGSATAQRVRPDDVTACGIATSRPGCCPNDGHPDQPPVAPRHAPLRRDRRGRPRRRRLRRRRRRARPAAGSPGMDGGRLRRRPVVGPRPRLGERRGRLAPPLLERAPRHRRRRPRPHGLQQLRARRRRLDGALRRLRPPLPSVGLSHLHRRRGRRRLADRLRGPASRTTPTSRRSCPVAGEDWPWGDPHRYPQSPHPIGGNGLAVPTRLPRRRDRRSRSGRSPSPTAASATGPTASTGASASRAARSTPRRRRSSPTSPTPSAHGAEIRPDCMVIRVDDRRRRPGHRRHLPSRRRRAFQPASRWWPSPATRSRRRDCSSTRPAPGSPTGCATTTTWSAATSWCKARPRPPAATTRRSEPTRRRRPEVSTEAFYETDPTQTLPAWLLDPVRVAAADHLRRARRRPRPLGCDAARVHARLRALGHLRCAVRVPAPGRQPGHPGRRDRPPRSAGRPLRLQPVRQRPRPGRRRPHRHGRRSTAAAGAEEVITINRYAHLVGGCRMGQPRPAGWSTPTSAPSPSPTSTSPTAACYPPREAPTRPSPSWRWPPGPPIEWRYRPLRSMTELWSPYPLGSAAAVSSLNQ